MHKRKYKGYNVKEMLMFHKLNTMKTETRRSVKMLKEEVQKLDDLYQQKVKVRT